MKKILIPIDGSDYSMRAVEKGVELAKKFDSEIVIINAIEYLDLLESRESEKARTDALGEYSRKILDKSKPILNMLNFSNYQLVSELDEPTNAICKYADKNGMDLIIMGSQGLNAGKFKGIFVGSITRKVISCTNLPVLVVK